jgi:hypothetical protein
MAGTHRRLSMNPGWAALASVAVMGLLVALHNPASAKAWTSNYWRSPTRNIACRYYPTLEVVTCETDNDHYSVAVPRYGKAFRTYYRWVPSYAPVLTYGQHWTAPGFNCWSRFDGMLCRTPAGHGFFLSRDNAEVF